jgi:hypothetical protein
MATKSKPTAFELYHINPNEIKKSTAWFNEKISHVSMRKMTVSSMMSESNNLTHLLMPGRMYAFLYDPKTKEDLPYYDSFPLVLPYDRTATHFIGLNLHYLPYVLRFELLKALLKISNTNIDNPRAKMKYDWDLIKNVARCAPAKACIKSYLFSHVKTPFMEIAPKEWHTAALLPFHQFHKSSSSRVWSESKGKF